MIDFFLKLYYNIRIVYEVFGKFIYVFAIIIKLKEQL